jgi:hypothetical protein
MEVKGSKILKGFATKFGSKKLEDFLEIEGPVIAEMYKEALISNIKRNKFGFKLAQSTIQARIRSGVTSTTPFIWTGDYLKAIIIDGSSVTVKSGKHVSGLTYSELSFILEHGRRDRGIPPRPVWRLTLEDVTPKIQKHLSKKLLEFYTKKK